MGPTSCQWWWGPGFFFGGPMGMLIGLVFWGAVIYGIVYLITHLPKTRTEEPKKEESPLEILKRRYARGELDADEYAKRRKDLEA